MHTCYDCDYCKPVYKHDLITRHRQFAGYYCRYEGRKKPIAAEDPVCKFYKSERDNALHDEAKAAIAAAKPQETEATKAQ